MTDKELTRLQAEVVLDPEDAEPHFVLARAYEKRNRDVDAIKEYGEVLKLMPDFGEAHYRLAWIYHHKLEDVERAMEHRRAAEALGVEVPTFGPVKRRGEGIPVAVRMLGLAAVKILTHSMVVFLAIVFLVISLLMFRQDIVPYRKAQSAVVQLVTQQGRELLVSPDPTSEERIPLLLEKDLSLRILRFREDSPRNWYFVKGKTGKGWIEDTRLNKLRDSIAPLSGIVQAGFSPGFIFFGFWLSVFVLAGNVWVFFNRIYRKAKMEEQADQIDAFGIADSFSARKKSKKPAPGTETHRRDDLLPPPNDAPLPQPDDNEDNDDGNDDGET